MIVLNIWFLWKDVVDVDVQCDQKKNRQMSIKVAQKLFH